jgi:hypothetical protein
MSRWFPASLETAQRVRRVSPRSWFNDRNSPSGALGRAIHFRRNARRFGMAELNAGRWNVDSRRAGMRARSDIS